MSRYHLNQALARFWSTTLGCWTGIAPATTSKTQCGPIIVSSEYSPHQCFGVPCWYNASPPSPDAGPASHQRLCGRPAMLHVLYPSPTITDRSVLQMGPQLWFNAGSTLLVRIMNKTLPQHRVNAYNSFHLYINMLFFRLTSRINPSCQTDAVLITANKLQPCMVLTLHKYGHILFVVTSRHEPITLSVPPTDSLRPRDGIQCDTL